MALLLKPDALFLHVPKTGGSWIRKTLFDLDLVRFGVGHKHAPLDRLRRLRHCYPRAYWAGTLKSGPGFQARLDRAFAFYFVRHPASWYESYFLYMKTRGWPKNEGAGRDRFHPLDPLLELGIEEFDEFIRHVVERAPGFLTRLYGSYAGSGVRFVGKQERLVADFHVVLDRIGISIDPALLAKPRENARKPGSGALGWDPGLKRELLRQERPLLETYGYGDDPRELLD